MSYGYQESAPTRAAGTGAVRSGSVIAGVVLIVAGGLLLAAQFVPGLEWWTLWPALIMLAGLIQMVTPGKEGWGIERVSEGFGSVFIGAILLGCTTGYIGWEMWLTALALWPALLIMGGLAMLGQATGSPWLKAAAPLVVWVAIAYAAASTVTGMPLEIPVINTVRLTVR